MIIGVPKEIKNNENRISMTPAGVNALVLAGHEVWVQKDAGVGSGFTDESFVAQGAKIIPTAQEVWTADLVVKVKEPLPEEYEYLSEKTAVFTYLHIAAVPALAESLLKAKATSIAYETVTNDRGQLPLLIPMSEVAGRMAIQVGAQFLTKQEGGAGILLGGVPGVPKGKVVIIGGGAVGTHAARIAMGLGAQVTILDISPKRLSELEEIFGHHIHTLMSNPLNIAEAVKEADLLIGAVLIPGAKAPKLVTERMVKTMKPGSVIVDVAVDQGGVIETCDRVSSHDDPIYVKHGVLHYAVPNIPGAVARTSTIALTNVTLPYILELAKKGIVPALQENNYLRDGLTTYQGYLCNKPSALDLQMPYKSAEELLQL